MQQEQLRRVGDAVAVLAARSAEVLGKQRGVVRGGQYADSDEKLGEMHHHIESGQFLATLKENGQHNIPIQRYGERRYVHFPQPIGRRQC